MVAIGIDLGTTNCCVGVFRNGQLEVIPNSSGKRTTPSWISLRNGKFVVGDAAKQNDRKYMLSTVYDIKYVIGLMYGDAQFTEASEKVPLVVLNQHGLVKIAFTENKRTVYYTPQELSGILLKELKSDAETYLKCIVDKAVITVPTYFTDAQRQATIDAGRIAEFNEVQLLNEPTAAAIAYGEENLSTKPRNVLVYDFGGGTFDVSVIKCENTSYEVQAIDGDLQLGGQDINRKLMFYVMDILRKEHCFNITDDERKVLRLKALCETAKVELATESMTNIELLDFIPNIDCFDIELNLKTYNKLNEALFNRTISIVQKCLHRGNFTKDDIDEVVLVGGSTRNVRVVQLLNEFLGKPIKQSIHPDEAVAIGAAIVAAKWDNTYYRKITFCNITPYSLGVEIKGEIMSVLIPKHSKLPIKKTKHFITACDGQTSINVKIYSGDDKFTYNNKLLGEFVVSGIVAGPSGRVLEETFEINEDCILTVTAVDHSGQSKQLSVTVENGRMNETEIQKSQHRISSING